MFKSYIKKLSTNVVKLNGFVTPAVPHMGELNMYAIGKVFKLVTAFRECFRPTPISKCVYMSIH